MPDFMKGLAKGINKSRKYVEAAVSGVADAMTLMMQPGLNVDMDGISGTMMNGSSGGVVNNYYNNDNSRQSTRRIIRLSRCHGWKFIV